MGTIVPRKRKNGSTAYHAQVIIKRDGRIAYRETRTFDRKSAASAWIDKTEEALLNPRALDEVRRDDPPLRSVIERYMAESKKAMGRTKKQVLKTLMDEFEIADMLCSEIGSSDITSLATELGKTRQPATVANYLSHLGAVFAIARAAWKYPLDPAVMKDGHLVAKKLGLTGKGKERDRRPTLSELNVILTYYQAREHEVEMLPMTKIVPFAIFSTRRQKEIVSIRWPDLDEEHSRILIRDMKNPTEKVGNNVWADIPPEAMMIIKSMPRVNPVLRGHLLPIRSMGCSDRVQDMFGRFVETPVVSRGELFGGKVCAALDRQHPRDLFDIKLLLDHEGTLSEEIKLGMIAGLVSHGRPIAELVQPRLKDREQNFKTEFEGMPFIAFTYDNHRSTFERLKAAVLTTLDDADRAFLLSFETGGPDWTLFPLESLQTLAGPQWKLHNLRHLRDTAPERHAHGVETLKEVLYPGLIETRDETSTKN